MVICLVINTTSVCNLSVYWCTIWSNCWNLMTPQLVRNVYSETQLAWVKVEYSALIKCGAWINYCYTKMLLCYWCNKVNCWYVKSSEFWVLLIMGGAVKVQTILYHNWTIHGVLYRWINKCCRYFNVKGNNRIIWNSCIEITHTIPKTCIFSVYTFFFFFSPSLHVFLGIRAWANNLHLMFSFLLKQHWGRATMKMGILSVCKIFSKATQHWARWWTVRTACAVLWQDGASASENISATSDNLEWTVWHSKVPKGK